MFLIAISYLSEVDLTNAWTMIWSDPISNFLVNWPTNSDLADRFTKLFLACLANRRRQYL